MLVPALKSQVAMCARALDWNLNGITEQDALVQPSGGGNCINWVVGHIVSGRETILSQLREPGVWPPELTERYGRGSAPVTDESNAPASLGDMRRAFEHSQETIMQALDRISEAKLDESVGHRTLGERLAFLQFHEAYHVGQVGVLRRLVGKEGAIK